MKKKEKIVSDRFEIVEIKGTSMLPTLKEGERVLFVKCNQYFIGDIVVFRYYNDNIQIHRIVGKETENIYICKGDNVTKKQYVLLKCIYGKMVKKL